jgi:16S rRNA (guanine527-N7)-methyltransferase
MQPEIFRTKFCVSRESFEQLKHYHALLVKWQRAINLVSPKTLEQAWQRHFVDSAQVAAYIPAGVRRVVDLGSGAGFPALVLAIMRPDIEWHLIESDERKAQFLRTVSRETNAPVDVHNARVEAVLGGLRPDLISARAFAPLVNILNYARNADVLNVPLLLMKGRGYAEEVEAARARYHFEIQAHKSLTDPEARILSVYKCQPHERHS